MSGNFIIKFLEGKWNCKNTIAIPGKELIKTEYGEEMKIKDKETLTITAFGIKDGKDLSKDMTIKLNDDNEVTLIQGDYIADGYLKGNQVTLVNDTYDDNHYEMKLYLLDNLYIYQMDIWNNNKIIQSQISYLTRV